MVHMNEHHRLTQGGTVLMKGVDIFRSGSLVLIPRNPWTHVRRHCLIYSSSPCLRKELVKFSTVCQVYFVLKVTMTNMGSLSISQSMNRAILFELWSSQVAFTHKLWGTKTNFSDYSVIFLLYHVSTLRCTGDTILQIANQLVI